MDPEALDDDGNSQLHWAVHNGKLRRVRHIMSYASNALISARNAFGKRAIHYAVYRAHESSERLQILKDLLPYASIGAELDRPGENPACLVAHSAAPLARRARQLLAQTPSFCRWLPSRRVLAEAQGSKFGAPGPKCSFCNRPTNSATRVQLCDGYSSTSRVANFHLECLEWAPRVRWKVDGQIIGAFKELHRARQVKCFKCKKRGAVTGCFVGSCSHAYHLPCARENGCEVDPVKGSILCPRHRTKSTSNDGATQSLKRARQGPERSEFTSSSHAADSSCGPPRKNARLSLGARLIRRLESKHQSQDEIKEAGDGKVLIKDISGGIEVLPIQLRNLTDGRLPDEFRYIKQCVWVPPLMEPVSLSRGCDCVGNCADNPDCPCRKRYTKGFFLTNNIKRCEAVNSEGGIGVGPRHTVELWECSRSCRCSAACCNRVVGIGISRRLEVFKTQLKGWGVRALDEIPQGSFVCEYSGEVVSATEAESRSFTYLWGLAGGAAVDPSKYGNVARFINHSCRPNLCKVAVYTDHADRRYPRVAFFANQTIFPGQELSIDYKYDAQNFPGQCLPCRCYAPGCIQTLV